MKDTEVDTVETTLGIVIPPALKDLLITKLDAHPDFSFDQFSPDETVATYQQYLAEGFQEKEWLEHLLPIGRDDESAQLYFLNLQDSKPWLYSAGLNADPFYDPATFRSDCKFGLLL